MKGLVRTRVSGLKGKIVPGCLNVWKACNIELLWLICAKYAEEMKGDVFVLQACFK